MKCIKISELANKIIKVLKEIPEYGHTHLYTNPFICQKWGSKEEGRTASTSVFLNTEKLNKFLQKHKIEISDTTCIINHAHVSELDYWGKNNMRIYPYHKSGYIFEYPLRYILTRQKQEDEVVKNMSCALEEVTKKLEELKHFRKKSISNYFPSQEKAIEAMDAKIDSSTDEVKTNHENLKTYLELTSNIITSCIPNSDTVAFMLLRSCIETICKILDRYVEKNLAQSVKNLQQHEELCKTLVSLGIKEDFDRLLKNIKDTGDNAAHECATQKMEKITPHQGMYLLCCITEHLLLKEEMSKIQNNAIQHAYTATTLKK